MTYCGVMVFSLISNVDWNANLITGCLNVLPVKLYGIATRTVPSGPGCVSWTQTKDHLDGGSISFWRIHRSPTFMFRRDFIHRPRQYNWDKYFLDYHTKSFSFAFTPQQIVWVCFEAQKKHLVETIP